MLTFLPPDPVAALERLKALITQVDRDLALTQEHAGAVEADQQTVEHRSRLTVQRRRIAAALDRVDAGTYGCCCECGDAVQVERLARDATILFCADCQAERDASS